MTSTVARELIAFGPTESFTYPVPAGFVRQRDSVGAGVTLVSEAVRIDDFGGVGLSVSVIYVDDAAAENYDLGYEVLISSDGIDGATGGYKNAVWAPETPTSIVAGATASRAVYTLAPLTFPATQAIRLTFKNNAGVATATAPNTTYPYGKGLHVRVAERTQP